MHRSGTSCLAGCLAEAGLALGDVNQGAPHNRRGNQENRRIMDLHEDVLRDSGGSWLDPPQEVIWTDEHRNRRDAILKEYESYAVWGFKDPRTLLTMSGWREALPGMRAVGTFRHPAAVEASLRARDGLLYEKGLKLWADYNRRLLRYRDTFGCELVSFDLPAGEYFAQVARIARGLGLRPPEEKFQFFGTHLRHHPPEERAELPSDIAEIYRRLLDASERAGSADTVDVGARKTPELSVVMVVYNMAREAPRTLRSLSPGYQQRIDASDYEVIVIDNGSDEPLGEETVESFGPGFRYVYVDNASPSPGMLASGLDCLRRFPRAIVGSVGFHLGPDCPDSRESP